MEWNPWAKARRLDRVIDHYAHDFEEQHHAYLAVCAERDRLAAQARLLAGDLHLAKAELNRLRAQEALPGSDHDQYACLERDQDVMKEQLMGARAGTVLRFTDTGGSVVLDQDGHWVPR